jgi:hypothetical protein
MLLRTLASQSVHLLLPIMYQMVHVPPYQCNKAAGNSDTLTAPEPGERVLLASTQSGRPPGEPAGADDHRGCPQGGDVGAGAGAGPHECGGDPLRCRGGTVVYRAVFYADSAVEVEP